MMSLRSLAALSALVLQLCNCAATAGKPLATDQDAGRRRSAAIEEMERRHDATMMTSGSGGGGGGM